MMAIISIAALFVPVMFAIAVLVTSSSNWMRLLCSAVIVVYMAIAINSVYKMDQRIQAEKVFTEIRVYYIPVENNETMEKVTGK